MVRVDMPRETKRRQGGSYMHRRGFTLIELVTVVVILAVSSAVAVPVYISYRDQAQSSAEQQTVAAIRQSIANHHSRELLNGKNTYPTSLDNVPANSEASNGLPFFGTVLSIPINSGWQKGGSALTYVGPTGATYVYDPTRGTFGTPSGDGATTPNGSSYSLAELLAMTPEQLAALSLDEIHALSEEQIAALSYKQFEAIANKLAPEQIPWATPEQIAMLSAEAYGDLSQAQMARLTQAQVDERAFADSVRALTYNDIRHLEVRAIKYLTTDQIASIPNNYSMGQIPAELRAAFTEDQVQALNTAQVSIGYLSADQRELLTTAQIENLGTYGDIRHLPASRIAEVTTDLIATIPNSYAMGQIPSDVRAGFTAEQIQAVNTGDISIGYLTADQRNQLTTAQIEGLGTYGDIRHLPASRVSEVTTDLIATIPNSYAMGQIPADVRAGFTNDQIQAINTGDVSIGYLTADQRNQLTTSQIEGLGSYDDIRHVPSSRIGEVTTDLIATIPNSYAMGQISAEVRAGFTTEQIQAVNTGDVSIGYLTADQRSQLTTTQIEGLGSYDDIRHLPGDRITEVTTDLIATIPNSYAMGQIPGDVRAGFSEAQVQAIDTANVSIGYLSSAQREQLTTTQITGLGSFDDIRHLPNSRITEVTTDLIASIPNSYAMGQIPGDVRAGFSEAQVQAIDTANVSIGYLSSAQREQLTTTQITNLSTYGDIRHLSANRVAEVSTDLIATIPNSYAMGQISSDVRAGFTASQVQSIDTANVSIGYLNDTQRGQLTTQQVASLGTSGDIRHLSSDRIAEVSTSLVAQIDSAYSFNQISTANVQAFTAAQVSAISGDFYDSISHRLTAEQRSWR